MIFKFHFDLGDDLQLVGCEGDVVVYFSPGLFCIFICEIFIFFSNIIFYMALGCCRLIWVVVGTRSCIFSKAIPDALFRTSTACSLFLFFIILVVRIYRVTKS